MVERRLLCVYGSVTGKSQSIAEQLADAGQTRGLQIELFSFESFGKSWSLDGLDVLIIVSSTTGDGEQPEAVTKFWRKLRPKSLPGNFLSHVEFSVLGLGDTNYNQFCNAPKNLRRRLLELGANEFYPPGWADDGTDLELVVEPWLDGLWPTLNQGITSTGQVELIPASPTAVDAPAVPVSSSTAGINNMMETLTMDLQCTSLEAPTLKFSARLSELTLETPAASPRYLDVELSDDVVCPQPHQNSMKLPLSRDEISTAMVLHNSILSSPDAVKTYLEMVLQPDKFFEFLPGDTVGILCENTDEDVVRLAGRLDLDSKLDKACSISVLKDTKKLRAKVPEFCPRMITLRALLKTCVDVRAVPKKLFLRALAEYTAESTDKRRLEELCSKQGSAEYLGLICEAQVSLLDILDQFASCRPPLSLLLEHLPRLLPRPYSISSSPLVSSDTFSFVYTVVDAPRPGLATSFLRTLGPGDSVRLYPRTSTSFHPPADPNQSYIMVCAGSGIGPFLGFLEHRRQLDIRSGSAWLVFGCRDRNKDFLHQEKIESFLADGHLSRLLVAYSREDDNGGGRYVQDCLVNNSADVSRFIVDENADVYVCGDAKNMGKSVYEAFAKVLNEEHRNGEEYVKNMGLEKRYKQDIWT